MSEHGEHESHAVITAEIRARAGAWMDDKLKQYDERLADRLDAAHKRDVDALKQRCTELSAEVAAKDEVIKRLNDAIAEEQERTASHGNAAKLREALETLVDVVETWQDHFPSAIRDGEVSAALDKAEAALAEPVKNCEVGTAMEQGERFSAYCRAHKHPESECLLCPLFGQTGGHCELVWAQMPYDEEGGAK